MSASGHNAIENGGKIVSLEEMAKISFECNRLLSRR